METLVDRRSARSPGLAFGSEMLFGGLGRGGRIVGEKTSKSRHDTKNGLGVHISTPSLDSVSPSFSGPIASSWGGSRLSLCGDRKVGAASASFFPGRKNQSVTW